MGFLGFSGAMRMRSPLRGVGLLLVSAAVALVTQATVAGPPAKAAAPPRLSIVIEGRGTLIVELDTKTAPKTCAHIVALATSKFYDHLLFHRVIKGYVAQMGDPKSRNVDGAKIRDLSDQEVTNRFGLGNGGSNNPVVLEPGGIHERGTVGMARGAKVDSNDSQFFFNLDTNHSLDYAYTEFGKVVSGIEELPKPKPGEKQDRTMTLERGLKVMDAIKQGDRIATVRVLAPVSPASKK
ncbi:MAG TPA: peptidylprolyl isomerase [Chthonomonadaceae bacterium]|nr:peptidylprolyl isomerase [Chthonomonadaceae bacterium]